MKRILLITFLATFSLHAQQRPGQGRGLNPEEIANVQAKKTTLALALNQTQQEKVYAIFLEQAKKREEVRSEREKMKAEDTRPSKEMRLKMTNVRLDSQIALQNQMKNVLTAEQFEKWQKMKKNRKSGLKEGRKSRRKNRSRNHH